MSTSTKVSLVVFLVLVSVPIAVVYLAEPIPVPIGPNPLPPLEEELEREVNMTQLLVEAQQFELALDHARTVIPKLERFVQANPSHARGHQQLAIHYSLPFAAVASKTLEKLREFDLLMLAVREKRIEKSLQQIALFDQYAPRKSGGTLDALARELRRLQSSSKKAPSGVRADGGGTGSAAAR